MSQNVRRYKIQKAVEYLVIYRKSFDKTRHGNVELYNNDDINEENFLLIGTSDGESNIDRTIFMEIPATPQPGNS